ncbi:MAG: ABC transporter ATP-binding protein [Candidatus Nitrohelix vancouverensis]|uniref:ABC transporter ATP-binding protein n=1 Tax=Candidatus Nitrohelix vancouverensis TaxID=2705534 RepID=A0A7T0C486_9BACT|nr:MAG: ABC transporter ATP-binding protein [Candidatus Nitrohelix vancouverensis]
MKFDNIKFFLPFFLKYRKEFAWGILALLVTDAAGLAIPWLLKEVIDSLPQAAHRDDMIGLALLIALVSVIQAVCRFGWRKFLFGPSRKIERDLLDYLLQHLLKLDKSFYLRFSTGDLMSRATNDLRAVRDFFGLGLLILVDAVVVIVAALILMLMIHPMLTLWVVLPLPIVSFLFFGFIREIGKRHEIVQTHLAKITTLVQENIAGVRTLHSFVQEEQEKKKFNKLNQEYVEKNLNVAKLYGTFSPSYMFTLGIAALISLWVGGKATLAGEMTLGDFVAFNGYLMMLSWPMMGMGYVVNLAQKGRAAMKRVHEIFQAEPKIADSATATAVDPDGDIEFCDASFTYPGAASPALRQIDLLIPKGSVLAITGSVGSGKSSLVKLIPRLYDPQSGSVKVGGHDLNSLSLESLRRWVGFVGQEPFLFSMTIRENIALGRPQATLEEINRAAANAGLAGELERFPDGLETLVGERGVSLSGGQKQRVALARILLVRPEVLILDDALSGLDVETEARVMENIAKEMEGSTLILVSHRLPALRRADQIIYMERGVISEKGDFNTLMANKGRYAETYNNQVLAMEMEIALQ